VQNCCVANMSQRLQRHDIRIDYNQKYLIEQRMMRRGPLKLVVKHMHKLFIVLMNILHKVSIIEKKYPNK
jgi:hypothetical protein